MTEAWAKLQDTRLSELTLHVFKVFDSHSSHKGSYYTGQRVDSEDIHAAN